MNHRNRRKSLRVTAVKAAFSRIYNQILLSMKKYYKSKKEAVKARDERNEREHTKRYGVFKMSKGTRHHGEYAVCSEMEWLNTY